MFLVYTRLFRFRLSPWPLPAIHNGTRAESLRREAPKRVENDWLVSHDRVRGKLQSPQMQSSLAMSWLWSSRARDGHRAAGPRWLCASCGQPVGAGSVSRPQRRWPVAWLRAELWPCTTCASLHEAVQKVEMEGSKGLERSNEEAVDDV